MKNNSKLFSELLNSGKSEMDVNGTAMVEVKHVTSMMYAFGIRPGRLYPVIKVSTYKHLEEQRYSYTIYVHEIKQTISVKPHFVKEV